jgi:4-amino-4-deoxy-L-arabinose transferase-like glycosyltransferase
MGGGGFLDSSRPGAALVALLKAHAADYTWVAATVDANNAAGYQLSTGDPVMAIGGFNGTDPAPSLAQFQTYVRDGKVHYFIAGGRGLGGGRSGTSSSQITSWVQGHFSSQTIDGVTVYDLTAPVAQT